MQGWAGVRVEPLSAKKVVRQKHHKERMAARSRGFCWSTLVLASCSGPGRAESSLALKSFYIHLPFLRLCRKGQVAHHFLMMIQLLMPLQSAIALQTLCSQDFSAHAS